MPVSESQIWVLDWLTFSLRRADKKADTTGASMRCMMPVSVPRDGGASVAADGCLSGFSVSFFSTIGNADFHSSYSAANALMSVSSGFHKEPCAPIVGAHEAAFLVEVYHPRELHSVALFLFLDYFLQFCHFVVFFENFWICAVVLGRAAPLGAGSPSHRRPYPKVVVFVVFLLSVCMYVLFCLVCQNRISVNSTGREQAGPCPRRSGSRSAKCGLPSRRPHPTRSCRRTRTTTSKNLVST